MFEKRNLFGLLTICIVLVNIDCVKLKKKFEKKLYKYSYFNETIPGTTICSITCPTVIYPESNTTCAGTPFAPLSVSAYKDNIFVSGLRESVNPCGTFAKVRVETNGFCEFVLYPNTTANDGSCENLVSVSSSKVDCCENLWLLDTGIDVDNKPLCSPKIVRVNLTTNQIEDTYELPPTMFTCNATLQSIEVAINSGSCSKPFIFFVDSLNYYLYVFSPLCYDERGLDKTDCLLRYEAVPFYPDPDYSVIYVDNEPVVVTVGIYSVAIGSQLVADCPSVYFHSLSSHAEYMLDICYLVNPDNIQQSEFSLDKTTRQVKVLGTRNAISSGEVVTADGIMFSAVHGDGVDGVVCWNTSTPYWKKTVRRVISNPHLRVTTSLAIVEDGNCYKLNNHGGTLLALSTDLLSIIKNNYTIPCDRITTVLISAEIDDLTAWGKCS